MSSELPLRAYFHFARCAFQRRAAYRLANWTGIVVNFFFFLIQAQVYLAFFGTRRVDGWEAADAVRYFATSQALLMVLGVLSTQTGIEMAQRIRSGDIAVDLARPVHLWARYVAESYGTAVYYILARAVVLYVGALLLYHFALPGAGSILLTPVAIALGCGVAALLMYLASATAFWAEQAHGPLLFTVLALSFFGGLIVPLDFYPTPLRWLCDSLPFRAATYTPVALATGKLTGAAAAFGLLHQVTWLGILAWVAARIEERGLQRVAVHGG